jgi:pyrimidine operon attenuation protein/uracil phosphoribosyltransferase
MNRSKILSHDDILLKLDRITWQILEHHFEEKRICIAGIKDRGNYIASELLARLSKRNKFISFFSTPITINKEEPYSSEITIENSKELSNSVVIIVDDVLNSGITMAVSLKEILNHKPKAIKVAVLADRSHKKFPIKADYVGISMATTLMQHISFEKSKSNELSVWIN